MHYSGARSHAGEACAKVQKHVHISRGMCTSLGTCELLVGTLRSWGKIQVNQHTLRSMCTRVGACALLWHTLTHGGSMHKSSDGCAHVGELVQKSRSMRTSVRTCTRVGSMCRSVGGCAQV